MAADAARRVGRASAWITSLARRYNRDGAAAVTRKNSTKPSHRANSLRVPERISLPRVPAYSPELNPSERVWPLVKEGVANRAHENLAELEQRVCSSCQ